MPTASRSGTRKATRPGWQGVDRPRSHPGVRSRSRPNPFTELAAALDALIRFHQSHPDWFPPPSGGARRPVGAVTLDPEWEAAIRNAYQSGLDGTGNSSLDQNLTAGKNAPPRSSFGQVLNPTTVSCKSCPDFPDFQVRPDCAS